MATAPEKIVLQQGEFYHKQRFGPETINRGAVLLGCEWSGGLFEAGVMAGGLFRSGEFRGGTAWGVVFWGGQWRSGTWESGYDRQGYYRPRTDHPPHSRQSVPLPIGRKRSPRRPHLVLASPHRYPDLARLWYRAVARDLAPALERAGLDFEVLIFRDANVDHFDPRHFSGATLVAPRPGARDFMEFYDAALAYECDYLLLLDADVFFLDGAWPVSYFGAFDAPEVAAVSFLNRVELPAMVYALLCRAEHYRSLPPPAFAAWYEGLERWPDSIHREPGERASMRLREGGKKIVNANTPERESRLVDFHGTTVLRAARDLFGVIMGDEEFEALVCCQSYFAQGAYDNALLGALYQTLFGEAYAPGKGGETLGGSLTIDALRRVLGRIRDPKLQTTLQSYFKRSDRAIMRLADREAIEFSLPPLVPETW